ncbi:MAG: L-lactate dehydrogenase [Candidatus Pacebacteria bacterium CG_4_10_14_0_8_um_filter_43_12]|nr:MAG: L-lactate dehydrogenase [Candidatus Pacebacteria bacterium CG_4_10_14_0_8_um_filter_43_12]
MKYDSNKVAIVGCGKVGMTAAYSLLHSGVVNDLVLLGRHKATLIGEQLDLEHGISFLPYARVMATDRYEDLAGSDVVIICAGAAQKPGDTRLDLAGKNIAIIEQIIPEVVKNAPDAIIMLVSNPVDVLTYKAYLLANLPKGRIFGSGTTLDTARFRFHLAQDLHVNPRSVHAYILGEHGDSSFPAVSSATVGGQPLASMPGFSEDRMMDAYQTARDAAYKIIASKGATFYGIGSVISHIVKQILTDSKSVLPLSVPLHNYQGISGVALSVPCVIGRNGVEASLEIKLDWEEKKKLEKSAKILKEYLQ